jgi:AhpD family alkylhydroperoxidase
MKKRIDYFAASPNAMKGMLEIEKYISTANIDKKLLELVKTRASQLNRCAYCLDMHTKDARIAGETEQRLYTLPAWRETPFFSEKERAALAWTEALTLLPTNDVSDAVYDEIKKHFTDKELVDLTMAIVAINGWNRLSVGFRTIAGTYNPK